MKLPPGINRGDFAEAIKQFDEAVGKQWVFTSDEDVALYRDAYSPFLGEPDEIVASAAVAPDGVEHVQSVVRIANRYKIPIYPISTGRNLGYGGSAPVLSGSVVLDLKRMNRILEVNERNAYALVEPGVSYFDLYRHIQEKGLKLWLDVPDPGWGSLVGNSLDHGAGYTPLPFRDHFESHCGMEVVLANGELLRTGMGAVPKAQTWQQFKYGLGPYVDGLFSQSNFGVVTKMGFWLMPQPEAYRVATVWVPKYNDIIPFVDIMARLMNSGTINCHIWIESPAYNGPPDPAREALLAKPDGGSPEEWDRYAQDRKIKFWGCPFSFYGLSKVIDAQWEHVKEQFSAIPGAAFEEGESFRFPLTPEQIERVGERSKLGIPSLGVFSMGARSTVNPTPNNGHLWLASVIPMTGEAVLEAQRVFTKAFREWGVTPSVGLPQSYHWRTFVLLYGFPITDDIETNKKNRATFDRMLRLAADHGWGEYRTHTAFMDTAVSAYSFNDHALLRFHERLKDAVDPNGILSAGRYGIWPRQLRKART
jgi:4-cresol dehydrogenase (hydroxylating)